MADRTGQQLGNYRLLRLLGRGGFAEVYQGQHIYLSSQAALKVLQVMLNDEDVEGFAKEARTLASLNHPHIVRVLDFAVEHGTPFLVMEYAANGTLRQRHPPGSRVPSESILHYIRQVASALQYAHDQHLIHRDVKPENMLLGSSNEILLSDFGLAIMAAQSTDQSTQAIGASLAGTTAYLSPEQLQGKPQPASDQYALGIVVYEWLCGKRPFSGSPLEIAMQHISRHPPPLREQLPGISPLLEEVVLRALAKEPQRRFANLQDFATALERAYQYTLQPRFSFAPSEDRVQNLLKPGPMWKMPTIFTPLIGRDQEVANICALLQQPEVRLLTLLGTGGIGKTRLSVQAAREIQPHFADGVCFVHLAEVSEPELVIPSIAQELGIQEIGAQPVLEQMKVALRDKHFLLLLDNFEQVMLAAPFIEELLAACPCLKVMVTSREALQLQAERVFPVPPLDLPSIQQLPEEEILAQYAAVALFVERAQALQPAFRLTQANAHAIAEICVRLDGLPLAIELAAARSKVLPPHELLARLSQPFQVLSGRVHTHPLRHQTLRNALQWSYDLLTVEEQRLFRRLSVFAWGGTLQALEAVEKLLHEQAGGTISVLDGVTSLLDKSLLVQSVQEGEEPRLQMLLTVREYGLELLHESGEAEQVQRAHAAYFLAFAEEAEPHLKGAEQITWLARLELAQENTRAALTWLIEHAEADSALRLCGALWWFWHLRDYWSEGRRWLEGALGIAAQEPKAVRARALYGAGNLAYDQDDYGAARSLLEECVQIYRELGIDRELATALGALGVLVHVQGDHATAHPLLTESEALCRTAGSKWDLTYLLRKFGQRVLAEGNQVQAVAYAQESLDLAHQLGDKSLIATATFTFASIAEVQGDLPQAGERTREGLTLARELGDTYLIGLALQNLGYLASLQNDLPQAAARTREGLAIARELGDKLSINMALHNLGYIAWRQGDVKQATIWYREGLSHALEIGSDPQVGWHLIGLANVAEAERKPWRAACLLGAAEMRLDVKVNMNDIERADYVSLLERTRNQVGESAFAAAWTEGRSMSPEQAIVAPERISAPPTSAPPTYPDGLTAREVEILCLLARGYKVDEIAGQLVISPRTVSTHITSIYRKISVSTRSAATLYAIEQKLCEELVG